MLSSHRIDPKASRRRLGNHELQGWHFIPVSGASGQITTASLPVLHLLQQPGQRGAFGDTGWEDLRAPFTCLLTAWLLCFGGSWVFFCQYPVLMHQMNGVSPWLLSSSAAVAHGLGLVLYIRAGL